MRLSASMYWMARYVPASTVNATPSTSSESDADVRLAPNATSSSGLAATAKISSTGIAHTSTIPSAMNSTGRVSSPAARRREASGTR